jgi:phenylalanyl-tRNA synthetase beta subunit
MVMSIFLTLSKEHELFHELIHRLEHSLKYDEPMAREELKRAVLVLLPALKRHEDIEDFVFANPVYQSREGARGILALVEVQHRKIEALRKDILEFLQTQEKYDFPRLKSMILTLCERLRLHFHIEETRLWPHYNQTMGRSVGQSINLRAQRQLKLLEDEIRQTRVMASDYVGGAS